MVNITIFQATELFIGLFTFWVGTYQLSQNVKSYFSWLIFVFFLAIGYMVFSDPILANTPDYKTYVHWQKLTDWPIFLLPAIYFHIAVYINDITKKLKPYLISAYSFVIILFFADLKGGLILREGIIRFDDFRRIDSFAPGVLMIPFVIYCTICFVTAIYYFNFARKAKQNNKYIYPIIGTGILTLAAIVTGASYYVNIPATQAIFSTSVFVGVIFNVYFILSYYQLVNNDRNIFDMSFVYRTVVLICFVLLYLVSFTIGRSHVDFIDLVFMTSLVALIIFSHSVYEWTNTFINDLLFNLSSGLSVVTDEEVYQVIRNFNSPDKLDSNSLQRLKNISKKVRDGDQAPIDVLRDTVRNSIDYFKPTEETSRRIKKNLKYQILKMIAFDQSEEGQILWELGFNEYPVAIMTRETKERKPMFQIKSPADYFYTSRNAYLALKKEAIHDVTWRISYLEKLAKK